MSALRSRAASSSGAVLSAVFSAAATLRSRAASSSGAPAFGGHGSQFAPAFGADLQAFLQPVPDAVRQI